MYNIFLFLNTGGSKVCGSSWRGTAATPSAGISTFPRGPLRRRPAAAPPTPPSMAASPPPREGCRCRWPSAGWPSPRSLRIIEANRLGRLLCVLRPFVCRSVLVVHAGQFSSEDRPTKEYGPCGAWYLFALLAEVLNSVSLPSSTPTAQHPSDSLSSWNNETLFSGPFRIHAHTYSTIIHLLPECLTNGRNMCPIYPTE